MKTIYVICEGQTEAIFVKNILSLQFDNTSFIFIPIIVETKNDRKHGIMYKGGLLNFSKFENTIKKNLFLLEKDNVYITTMIDFYALPKDTPGYDEAKIEKKVYSKIKILENGIKKRITDNYKFIPYIQLHEFETLLFTDLDELKKVYFEYENKMKPLYDAVKEESNIELINNGYETAPSKRIISCIPIYDKTVLGIQALKEIEFTLIREKCLHFNEWINILEKL